MDNSIRTPLDDALKSAPENKANASDLASDNTAFHLSPLSLIAKTITGLRSLIFPILAAFFALGDKVGYIFLLIGFGIFTLISLGFIFWAWKRFSYQIGAEEIRIESGILSRNARSIPYERIQDVSLEQSLIPRFLGISAVKFETGGSEGDEGTLEFVSVDEAENLRQLIRTRKAGVAKISPVDKSIATGDDDAIAQDEVIFSMDIKRIFTLGIFNFSLILFAVIAGAAQQFDFLLPRDLGDIIKYAVDSYDERSTQIKGIAIYSQIAAIVGLIFALIVMGMLSGQVQTFLREYGFSLTATDRGIRRQRGLLTLTDVVMPLHRVQAAIVQTGAIRKRFGWYALKFTSLGSDTGKESSHMMAPLAKDEEYWPIAHRASIDAPAEGTYFYRAHFSYMAASMLFSAFLIAFIFCLSTILPKIFDAQKIATSMAIINWIWIVALFPFLLSCIGWRYHFHAMDDRQIYVKSGFWNQKMTILPMVKVQTVDLAQGPISQYLKTADVKFGIAGGSGLSVLTIHNVPMETARHIRQNCINAAKNIDFSDLIKAPK